MEDDQLSAFSGPPRSSAPPEPQQDEVVAPGSPTRPPPDPDAVSQSGSVAPQLDVSTPAPVSSARDAIIQCWSLLRTYASDSTSPSGAGRSAPVPVSRHPELSVAPDPQPLSALARTMSQHYADILASSEPLQAGFLSLRDYRNSLRAYAPSDTSFDYSRLAVSGLPDVPLGRADITIPFRHFVELQRRCFFCSNIFSFLALLSTAIDLLAASATLTDQQLADLYSMARAFCVASRDGLALATSTQQSLLLMRRDSLLQSLSLPQTLSDALLRSSLNTDPRTLFSREASDMLRDHRNSPATIASTMRSARPHPYRGARRGQQQRQQSRQPTSSTPRQQPTTTTRPSHPPSTSRRPFRGGGRRGRS